MKYLIILLLSFSLFAEDEKLINQLEDNDFEVREKATQELGKADTEYCIKYLDLMDKYSSPEIRYRLLLAAKMVYMNKLAPSTVAWLAFYADLGFETQTRYISNQSEDQKTRNVTYYDVIDWVDNTNECFKVLNQHDIIVKINGVETNQVEKKWLLGKEYELTIRRYKDVTIFEDYNLELGDKEFKDFEVKIKIVKKTKWDEKEEKIMLDTLWEAYFKQYRKTKGE